METQRFINKSAFIEAIQFNGRNLPQIEEFIFDTNIQSATILNNVLYLIARTYDKAEFERWTLMPNDYLIKDASGYVNTADKDIIDLCWYPFPKK